MGLSSLADASRQARAWAVREAQGQRLNVLQFYPPILSGSFDAKSGRHAGVASVKHWRRRLFFAGVLTMNNAIEKPPVCHFTTMQYRWADDGAQQVEYWECEHCGHTVEIDRVLAG